VFLEHLVELAERGECYLTDAFIEGVREACSSTPPKMALLFCKAFMKERQTPETFPLNDRFKIDVFMEFVTRVRTKKGGMPTLGMRRSYRSAFRHIQQWCGVPQRASWEGPLGKLYKGFARRQAKDKVAGKVKMKEGKEPLPFTLYVQLCRAALEDSKRDNGAKVLHAYMVRTRTTRSRGVALTGRAQTLLWNLCSRASNLAHIRLAHLRVDGDALVVFFGQSKADQSGTMSSYPRHVYANPLKPYICPILALGLYLSQYNFRTGTNTENEKLFPGANQAERITAALHRFTNGVVAADMRDHSLTTSEISSHSFRKGSLTFLTGVATFAPNIVAIQLRAGWTLEGVQGRYLKYSAAGDQYVGRTISGLPLNSDFAMLPPHFISPESCDDDSDDDPVAVAIATVFPRAPDSLYSVLRMCLASMVYHFDFLNRTLRYSHPLRCTTFFTGLVGDRLKDRVKCCRPGPGTTMRATGIPAPVLFSGALDNVAQKVDEVKSAVDGRADDLAATMLGRLQGTHGLRGLGELQEQILNMVRHALTESGVALSNGAAPRRDGEAVVVGGGGGGGGGGGTSGSTSASDGMPSYRSFMWEGGLHPVPESFEMPRGNHQTAWHHYCRGDPARLTPPLRVLKWSDLRKGLRQQLREFKSLMVPMEERLKELGEWVEMPSHSQAQAMYDSVFREFLTISPRTPTGRKRRVEQISWKTIVRESKRRKAATVSAAGDSPASGGISTPLPSPSRSSASESVSVETSPSSTSSGGSAPTASRAPRQLAESPAGPLRTPHRDADATIAVASVVGTRTRGARTRQRRGRVLVRDDLTDSRHGESNQ
jgi:hypothetical protein